MKNLTALLLTIVFFVNAFTVFVFAEGTMYLTEDVYVSIVNQGKYVVTQEKLSVTDADSDGKITLNDALYLAHASNHTDGAAGYGYYLGSYGLSLSKLWGDTSGSFGYYLNNEMAYSLDTEVKSGDTVCAFIYSDTVSFSDVYSFFELESHEAIIGNSFELTLFASAFDESWQSVKLPIANAKILINGVDSGITTDENGKASLCFSTVGKKTLSAKSDDFVLIPPICTVNVTPSFDPNEISESIIKYILNTSSAASVQELIDNTLSASPENYEWYAFALLQSGNYDFSKYKTAFEAFLDSDVSLSAVEKQKYALVLLSLGSSYEKASKILDETVGAQGIVSYAFALHLLNNGCVSEKHTKESVTSSLLSLQKADGSWALSGNVGDPDITAMVIQALSPYYKETADVKSSIDRALTFLSEKQLDDGDFTNYGASNPETPSQVLIALSSLGIDALTDVRFIKGGKSLIDGIKKYRLEDGAFSHIYGEEFNSNATLQVLCAMISYQRMIDGEAPFYIVDVTECESTTETIDESKGNNASQEEKISYKVIAFAIIAGLCIISCVLLAVLKKTDIKYFLTVLIITAIAVCFVAFTNFNISPKSADPQREIIGSVTLCILCDAVSGKDTHIASDGIVLDTVTIDIESGDSVYDVLKKAANEYSLVLNTRGRQNSVYIVGINNINEFDFGNTSGWTYWVNGERPTLSCSAFKLKDGDTVEWHYSLSLGADITP